MTQQTEALSHGGNYVPSRVQVNTEKPAGPTPKHLSANHVPGTVHGAGGRQSFALMQLASNQEQMDNKQLRNRECSVLQRKFKQGEETRQRGPTLCRPVNEGF